MKKKKIAEHGNSVIYSLYNIKNYFFETIVLKNYLFWNYCAYW